MKRCLQAQIQTNISLRLNYPGKLYQFTKRYNVCKNETCSYRNAWNERDFWTWVGDEDTVLKLDSGATESKQSSPLTTERKRHLEYQHQLMCIGVFSFLYLCQGVISIYTLFKATRLHWKKNNNTKAAGHLVILCVCVCYCVTLGRDNISFENDVF